jgi:hypothetical protein
MATTVGRFTIWAVLALLALVILGLIAGNQ